MLQGCYTALITPFEGGRIDRKGLDALIDFQTGGGVSGILAVGTTGESPTLTWQEHNEVIEVIATRTKGKCSCIAGTGSNNTKETLEATRHAARTGAEAVLLVDPYYNGPSSLEIRREYVGPVAAGFPELGVIPYVIPGRTGAQLLPEDLALLARRFPNVWGVKEATGSLENMRRTRRCCGSHFAILSGDDDMTLSMMGDPEIAAAGVISVASNVAPRAVSQMTRLALAGDLEGAGKMGAALKPLFGLVTVKTTEQTPFGPVACRARNPLAYKTLMAVLGMPGGPCRPPLGKMTPQGLEQVLDAVRGVFSTNPEVLQPVAEHFGVDIERRLHDPSCWKDLVYEGY